MIIKYNNEKNEEFVMMQLRDDGKLGFVGGEINEGETIEDGIIREVMEEISFQILDKKKMVKLASFTFDSCEIHSYTYEIGYEEFQKIITGQMNGEHFLKELFGVFFVPITLYKEFGFVDEFLKNNFSGTAKEELKLLL